MVFNRIALSFILISSILLPLCASLTTGKYYYMRNDGEDSYLRILTGGVLCEDLGAVVTSETMNTTSLAYRWRYNEFIGIWKWLDIDTSNPEGLQLNELTVERNKGTCEPIIQLVNPRLISGTYGLYRVLHDAGRTCLTSNGIGNRISWETCDNENLSQRWQFLEV